MRAALWRGGSKAVPAVHTVYTRNLRREAPNLRDVPLLHSVDDRFDVPGAERDVVGHGRGTGGVQVDRRRRRAAGRLDPKLRVLELQKRFDVEVFSPILRISSLGLMPLFRLLPITRQWRLFHRPRFAVAVRFGPLGPTPSRDSR